MENRKTPGKPGELTEYELRAASERMVEAFEAADWRVSRMPGSAGGGVEVSAHYPDESTMSGAISCQVIQTATGRVERLGEQAVQWELCDFWLHTIRGEFEQIIASGPVGIVVSPVDAKRLITDKDRSYEEFNDRLKALLEERS